LTEPLPEQRKADELNRLLAVATGFAYGALLVAAWLFSPPEPPASRWVSPGQGVAVVVLYLLLKRVLNMKPTPPLIQPGAPATLFAGLFPLVILGAAAMAALWPGHNFLAVIVGGVWFGMTLEAVLPQKPRKVR
jgi:hypothetical protein